MQKTVILNFANDKGNYFRMQDRLRDSLDKVGYDGDVAFYRNEKLINENCPYHFEVPYAFKAYAINEALRKGYENIIWMDSAVYAVKPIDEFIEHIETTGYIFFNNLGFTIGDYTSDACLDYFGWSRQKAFNNPMIMACCFGLNTDNNKAIEFMSRYYEAAKDEVPYLGAWTNENNQVSEDDRVNGHRHDQSVASIIIADMKMKIDKGQSTYFAYTEHKKVMEISSSVCLLSQGI
jgi:hypothetical protein